MSTTRKWDDAIADEVRRKEDAVDHYEDALGTYLVQLSGRTLSKEDNRTINTLLHTIGDFERISDHSVNLLETAEEIRDKNIRFSDEALDDLSVLEAALQDIVNRTVDAFQKHDCYAAGKIEPLEEVVDGLVREVKTRHIARLQAGTCTIEYGFVLDDLLTDYERIADHCSNIAVAMIEVADDKFDTHEYLNQPQKRRQREVRAAVREVPRPLHLPRGGVRRIRARSGRCRGRAGDKRSLDFS